MLEVESSVVSLGDGRLAVYLPSDLIKDSAFALKVKDKVTIKADGNCLTICKREAEG